MVQRYDWKQRAFKGKTGGGDNETKLKQVNN